MQYPDAEILVMARAPVPGKTKTRLIPALGEEGAAMLHRHLLERLLTQLTEAAIAPVTLCCAPDSDHPFFQYCHEKYGVSLRRQQGAGLGERLFYVLQEALQRGRFAVAVGSDIPALTVDDFREALLQLERGHDAVLSPAEDGGYALLGLSRLAKALFQDIQWGSEQVLAQTRERLRAQAFRWRELRQVWDLDRPEDLPRLSELELDAGISRLLGQHGII